MNAILSVISVCWNAVARNCHLVRSVLRVVCTAVLPAAVAGKTRNSKLTHLQLLCWL